MILSDLDIKQELKNGNITIRDFDTKRLQLASYDVLLGNKFMIPENYSSDVIDPVKGIFPNMREIKIKDDEHFVLHPGVSVLGITHDYVGSKNEILIQISGKSSLARIGLIVHNTAGIVNPGHYLHITLELANLNNIPIILRPKMEIAQLIFSRLSSPTSTTYDKVGRFGNGEDNWKQNVGKSSK